MAGITEAGARALFHLCRCYNVLDFAVALAEGRVAAAEAKKGLLPGFNEDPKKQYHTLTIDPETGYEVYE